jgi:hypothetical protein
VKRAFLTLFLVVAALCGWLLRPQHVSSRPALEPIARQESEPKSDAAPIEPGSVSAHDAPTARIELPIEAVELDEPSAAPASPFPAALETDPKFGTIVGVVVRGRGRTRQPVGGARVSLRDSSGPDAAVPARQQTQVASTCTFPDGSFRFEAVEPGEYTLLAVDGTSEREGKTGVWRTKPSPPVLLAFGSSRIRGTVRDLAGAPLPNHKLRLESTTGFNRPPTPATLRALATTDANGQYSFGELAADTYVLELESPGTIPTGNWPARTWYLALGEGQDLELDAGKPRGADHWAGVLRREDGASVQEPRPISLGCSEPPDAKGVLWISIDAQSSGSGAFDFPLEPGEWMATVDADSRIGTAMQLELCTVPAGGVRHDIVLL